jgi:hypothetical protein
MKKIDKRQTKHIKNWLGCYNLNKNRYFEALFCKLNRILHVGFKYEILLNQQKKNYENLHVLKMFQFETSFNCFFFSFFIKKLKEKKTYISLYIILSRMHRKKKYIKARILNVIKSGYAVGGSGLVGFLPKSRSFNCDIGFIYLFVILSLDSYRFSYILLQKNNKTCSISKNNLSKRNQIFKILIN